jgi:hypothetical protein
MLVSLPCNVDDLDRGLGLTRYKARMKSCSAAMVISLQFKVVATSIFNVLI